MANITIEKLNQIRNNILNGKNELSNSLHMCGLKNVKPNDNFPHDFNSENYETFGQYANYIKKLATKNSFIMEFEIPESAQTVYKRTIVLPMDSSFFGNGNNLNTIADELIESDTGTYPITYKLNTIDNHDLPQEYYTTDYYGNKCLRGDIEIPNTNTDSNIINPINYTASYTNTLDDIPMYDFEVDWGDGTTAKYTPNASYEENKKAIWHTYEKPGVYDIAINGIFRNVKTSGYWHGSYVKNGEYVRDKDNIVLRDYDNYGMSNYLIEVISWGNTLFTFMDAAFRGCRQLHKIPMYDTTNSFSDVLDFSYGFHGCASLTSIPFNNETKKGLLSGCKKLISVYGMFYDCTNISSQIPEGLIDNCTNLTSVGALFRECKKLSGSVPNNMFKGLINLKNAESVFFNCSNMDGEISEDLFRDCPLVENINSIFYNCSKIKGRLTRNVIGGLSKLTYLRQAFYNCKSLEGIDADAFYNLKSDNINAIDAFYGCDGIKEIPDGLLESLTGNNLYLARMFSNCINLKTLSITSLLNLKVRNAMGMFGGCVSLSSHLPNENNDWNTYDNIQKWYGIFSLCDHMENSDSIPIELGGNGVRRFKNGKVGMVIMNDGSIIEINDLVNNNKSPVGFIYADLYIDEDKSIPSLPNGEGNLATESSTNISHKIFASTFNGDISSWTKSQNLCEDIPTITNYGVYSMGLYLKKYNGEAYTNAINDWRVVNGYAQIDENGNYIGTENERYVAFNYISTYNCGLNNIKCFMGDMSDTWMLYLINYFFKKCCNKICEIFENFNNDNCYPLANFTHWTSSENSKTATITTDLSYSTISVTSKFSTARVRPVFSIKL